MLTDTHTHIYYNQPDELINEINRAKNAGVTRLFLPNIDTKTLPLVLKISEDNPDYCYPMLGLHPCAITPNYQQDLATIYTALQKHKVYAIGEIGLDLFHDTTFLSEQKAAFLKQLHWAKEFDLPIVIHCRNTDQKTDAYQQLIKLLNQYTTSPNQLANKPLSGIWHCFSGSRKQATAIIKQGFYLGIGGLVTYKNAGLAEVLKQDEEADKIGIKHLVLETDAPYLTPAPFRGQKNESSYLVHIATKVAEIYGIHPAEVAKITTNNAKKIFKV